MASTLKKPSFHAYLALGIGVLSLGFSAIFIRWADAPGIVSSFYRMAVAAVLLALPFFQQRYKRGGLPKRGVLLAIMGGLFFAGDMALWSTGVTLGGATNPTLLANTAPVWVGVGALIFMRERLSGMFWLGLFLALAGASVVLGLDSLREFALGLGSFLGLLGGIFYGAYFLISQRGRQLLDSLSYFWLTVTSATLGLWLITWAAGQPFGGYTRDTYLIFLAMGVVSQVIGWLAINYAQGYLPATVVSPTLLGQPLATAVLAFLLLGETFTWGQIAGGLVVLAGVFIVHWGRNTS